MIKNILVTGNLGYVGSVLTSVLSKKFNVTGLDIGYFKNCNLEKENKLKIHTQIYRDIRKVQEEDLKNIDCIVHLAALSNDPLGKFNSKLTYEINYIGTIKLAKIAKKAGIKKFIFISTQSIYGISKKNEFLDEYKSKKNPVTIYAKSKLLSEKFLSKIKSKNFQVIILRPSTVFGVSPRLRTDIILNNFLLNAYYNKKITIISDGLPWRPVLHVQDLCDVIKDLIMKNYPGINGKAFNIGLNDGNYRVVDLAIKILKKIKNISIEITNSHSEDQRTYKVSFKRIHDLCGAKIITKDVDYGIKELLNYFKKINYKEKTINKKTVRINYLKYLIKKGVINKNFEFN